MADFKDQSSDEQEKGERAETTLGYVSDENDKAAQLLRDEYDPDLGKTAEERAAIVCHYISNVGLVLTLSRRRS